jgi:hypothetical protein
LSYFSHGGRDWCAGGVGGEELPVGPFGCQGVGEALCFVVLPGAVRADEVVAGTEGGEGGGEVVADAVAPSRVVAAWNKGDASPMIRSFLQIPTAAYRD